MDTVGVCCDKIAEYSNRQCGQNVQLFYCSSYHAV